MKILKYSVVTAAFILFLPFAVATALFAESVEHGQPFHWSYEGECGPEHWGELIHEYCNAKVGDMQSPVGISVTEKTHLDTINFHYFPTPLKILNNGHTIQVNYGSGSSITQLIAMSKINLQHFSSRHTYSRELRHSNPTNRLSSRVRRKEQRPR